MLNRKNLPGQFALICVSLCCCIFLIQCNNNAASTDATADSSRRSDSVAAAPDDMNYSSNTAADTTASMVTPDESPRSTAETVHRDHSYIVRPPNISNSETAKYHPHNSHPDTMSDYMSTSHNNDSTLIIISHTDTLSSQAGSMAASTPVGDFRFSIKDTMLVGTPYPALLQVARHEDTAIAILTIQKTFEGEAKPATFVDTTVVSNKMLAKLIDPTARNFKVILTDDDSIKTIDFNKAKYTEWEWTVTPLTEGDNKLYLSLSQVTNSGEPKDFIPSKRLSIHVYSKPMTMLQKVGLFFTEEWKWLIGSIAAFFGWFFGIRKGKKEQREGGKA